MKRREFIKAAGAVGAAWPDGTEGVSRPLPLSSPPPFGKLRVLSEVEGRKRGPTSSVAWIPACAGKTRGGMTSEAGLHFLTPLSSGTSGGSSPIFASKK